MFTSTRLYHNELVDWTADGRGGCAWPAPKWTTMLGLVCVGSFWAPRRKLVIDSSRETVERRAKRTR